MQIQLVESSCTNPFLGVDFGDLCQNHDVLFALGWTFKAKVLRLCWMAQVLCHEIFDSPTGNETALRVQKIGFHAAGSKRSSRNQGDSKSSVDLVLECMKSSVQEI